jgi:protein TonB
VPSEEADTPRVSRWFAGPRSGRRIAERPVEQAEVAPAPSSSEAEVKQSQSKPAVPDAPAELIELPARDNAPDDTGTAVLRVMVQADGTVSSVLVKRSSGSKAVDDFAVGLVRKARYRPAVRAGQPAAAWLDLPVTNRPAKSGRSDRPEQPGQDQ